MRLSSVVVVACSLVGLMNANADEPSVSSAPPVVVKTVPEAGTEGVDPALKEIRVTFSKDMIDKGWSWVTAPTSTRPVTIGTPAYEKDKRTCVLPVTLEPGKTYAFWINSAKFGNFKDVKGRPAVPYLLTFATK